MKNREFYKDKIMNWDNEKDGNFCSEFIETIVLKKEICGDFPCSLCETKLNIWLDEEHEEQEVDWSKVSFDTPILVSNDGKNWKKRYFEQYNNGYVYVYNDGSTSWSNECGSMPWKYAKLAEVNK